MTSAISLAELEREVRAILSAAHLPEVGLETRHLLSGVFGFRDVSSFLTMRDRPVTKDEWERAVDWSQRRAQGYPLAYLTGFKGFFKHTFFVEPGVLIPRPETEILIEQVLHRLKDTKEAVRTVADLGAGSGCIGLSLLQEFELAQLFAVDSAPEAIRVIGRNAKELGLESRTTSIAQPVADFICEPLDLVVANPPYIAIGDTRVETAVHLYEPSAALYSGATGLELIDEWLEWSAEFLKPGGLAAFEIGSGQTEPVRAILNRYNFENMQWALDLSGHERVVTASKSK